MPDSLTDTSSHSLGNQTFYLETRAVYQELDTLKETIYELEIKLRELEVGMVRRLRFFFTVD